MKKIIVILILGFIIGNLAASENALWNKAQKFIENGSNLIPGRIVKTTVVLNKKGKEKSRTEITTKTQKENEDVSVSFIEGKRNGTELLADDKEVEAALQQDFKPSEDSFFDDVISFKQTFEEKIINGKDCIGFDYTGESIQTKKKKEIKEIETGKLWIEKSTGVPVMREFTTDQLPKHMKKFNIKIYYALIENSCTKSEVDIKVVVSYLFMKFRVNTTMAFSEYWKYEGNL